MCRKKQTFIFLTLVLLTGCAGPPTSGPPSAITGNWAGHGPAGPQGLLVLKENRTFIANHLPERILPLPAPTPRGTLSDWTSTDHLTGTWTTLPGATGRPEVLILNIDNQVTAAELAINGSGTGTKLSYSYRNAESPEVLYFTRP